jgi:hypothetical protein
MKISQLKLYSEIIAVASGIQTKQNNALCVCVCVCVCGMLNMVVRKVITGL